MLPLKKKNIHALCVSLLQDKINAVKSQISEINRSFEDESKSSAGDKHETSRAMAQLETEKLHAQLHQLEMQMGVLKKINPESALNTIQTGSLVKTDKGIFYIAVPLGKVEDVMVISAASPLGKIFIGKNSGEEACFNGSNYRVDEIN